METADDGADVKLSHLTDAGVKSAAVVFLVANERRRSGSLTILPFLI